MSLLSKPNITVLVLFLFGISQVWANSPSKSVHKYFDQHPEKGWYFYQKIPKKMKPHIVMLQKKSSLNVIRKTVKSKKDLCKNYLTWKNGCGFIDPTKFHLSGKEAYIFEQKEYKQLMHNYALYPENQNMVYQFQRFNMWTLDQAMTASYMWQYNKAQHPDVDANVQTPVSQFGIHIIKNIENNSESNFWHTLSKTAFFVLATKTNNKECQAQGTIMRMLEHQTGVVVWNFSIDRNHLPGFKHYMNYPLLSDKEKKSITSHLKLNWLPTIYLYLKPVNAGQIGRWIRISSGITPLDQISSRTINFVEAYRHAIVEGVGKSKHIVPNFKDNHLYQLGDEEEGLNKTQNTVIKIQGDKL